LAAVSEHYISSIFKADDLEVIICLTPGKHPKENTLKDMLSIIYC
jgi:hypothetical protein